jgi:putative intracellular protease/amidase
MSKALIVATQATDLGGHTTGAWLEEVAAPYYVFTEAKYAVDFASPKGGKVPLDAGSLADGMLTDLAKKFQTDATATAKLDGSLALTAELATSYDIVFFAGGHGTCVDFPALGGVAAAAHNAGKVLAAVCHGPTVLCGEGCVDAAGAPLIKGKKVTGFSDEEEKMVGLQDKVPYLLEAKLKELGGIYSSGPAAWGAYVVVDGRLVTGQNPGSSEKCAEAALQAVAGEVVEK